ncbi:MAG: hypothetical protein AAGG51_06065 [Cyanobacteria bacterium P01_G01_bin.54]
MFTNNRNSIASRLLAASLCFISLSYSIPSQNVQAMGSSYEKCSQPPGNINFIAEHSLGLNVSKIPVNISRDTTHYVSHINIAWSPDGRFFARKLFIKPERKTSLLQIFDAGTGNIIIQRELEGQIDEMFWSPDSQSLAFPVFGNGETRVQLLNLITQEDQFVELEKRIELISQYPGIEWSPDSQHFAIVGEFQNSHQSENSVQIISIRGSSPSGKVIYEGGGVGDLAWSPNSSELAIAHLVGFNYVVSIFSLREQNRLEIPNSVGIDSVEWFGNNKLLIVGSREIGLIDFTNNNEFINTPPDLGFIIALSNKRQYFAVRTYDQDEIYDYLGTTTRIFDLETNEFVFETPQGRFRGDQYWSQIMWSPDDKYLAINDAECGLSVYATVTGDLVFHTSMVEHNISGRPLIMFGLSWSPDSRYLAMSGEDGDFRIINLETQREVARIEHGSTAYFVLWSPDGQKILMSGEYGEFIIELER